MKPKIAFVTGGYASEAKISYLSAATIEKNIDPEKFDHYKIDITPNGWFYINPNNEKFLVDKSDFTLQLDGRRIKFDAVLIGIHGTPGEDGKLQGYFDLLNIPYTSCDCAVSALTFNKRYTVAVAAFSGINVANSILLFKNNYQSLLEDVRGLQFPVFVKPNNGGSSIGMSKVELPDETLEVALEKAFKEDEQVLVEEFISGREFSIGVFKTKGKIIALPMTEIVAKNSYFDYESKYEGGSTEITPAKISDDMLEKINNAATKIYETFNCRGVVRIDFIYNVEKDAPYMLEINTIPGQTDVSLVPQQIRAYGWKLQDLYTALIEECLPA
ncbi:MAG: D-alanine--D-alanine ligase [Ginsengibacter sp.]